MDESNDTTTDNDFQDAGDSNENDTNKSDSKNQGQGGEGSQGSINSNSQGDNKLSKGHGRVLGKGYGEGRQDFNNPTYQNSKLQPVTRFDDHSFWKGEDKQNINKTTSHSPQWLT